jgi:hypothetical protein
VFLSTPYCFSLRIVVTLPQERPRAPKSILERLLLHLASEPCSFFPELTMADNAAIAAMEMANLALANAAADATILPGVPGVDAAVAIPPVVTQPSPTVGEPVLAPVLPVAPTASEAIRSAGLHMAASAARSPPAPPMFDVPMHEAGTSLGPVVRHDFNRAWLSIAIAYSKEHKYDGLSMVPEK